MITLTLTDAEASAVSIALVGLIHDPTLEPGDRWALDASAVAVRLEAARNAEEATP